VRFRLPCRRFRPRTSIDHSCAWLWVAAISGLVAALREHPSRELALTRRWPWSSAYRPLYSSHSDAGRSWRARSNPLRQAVGFLGLRQIVVEPPEKLANFHVELLGSLHAADMTDSRHDDKL
jgi:hypothetical protein